MRSLTLFTATLAMVLGMSLSANAATLSIATDKTTYAPGETITMTITGDSEGGTAASVIGRILNTGAGGTSFVSATQSQLISFGGFLPWVMGGTTGGKVFDQVGGLSPLPVDNLLTSTVFWTADTLGVAAFDWLTSGTQPLSFFGLTSGAGHTVTIVPEPTTASLMGLGLIGLAISGRRRKS
jgi:hypothetical protein